MPDGAYPISDFHLILSLMLVLIVGMVSSALKLGLLKQLAIGTFRTFAQLFLMGYVLIWIFRLDSPLLVTLILLLMCYFGARIAVKRTPNVLDYPLYLSYLALTASTFLVTFIVTAMVISAPRWYTARVVIPIAGMVLGNSMNGIALGIDRLYAEVRGKSAEIEALLSLGATPWEAVRRLVKEALRAGMTPSINSMMAVGIVFIPGMMTGQILGGSDPLTAIRYQIVVMLMVTAGAAIGCLMLVLTSYKRCFNSEGALKSEYSASTLQNKT
jgi:putative ABC transport system permease protein